MVEYNEASQVKSASEKDFRIPWILRWEGKQTVTENTLYDSNAGSERAFADIDFIAMLEELEFK